MMTSHSRRRRATTLGELMIATAIAAMVSISLIMLFVQYLKHERQNIVRLRMAKEMAQMHRELRDFAASPGVIDESESFVEFRNRHVAQVSRIEYQDDDDDPSTIGDNRIVLIPDVDNHNVEDRLIIRYVSPLVDENGVEQPIFRRPATVSFGAPLIIEFRIGDRSRPDQRNHDEEAKKDDAFTGDGFQSLVFRSVFSPRNI